MDLSLPRPHNPRFNNLHPPTRRPNISQRERPTLLPRILGPRRDHF